MFHKTFHVKVTTGSAKGAGTNAHIHITLIDEENQTHRESLDKWFHNDFRYNQEDIFKVHAPHDFGKCALSSILYCLLSK